MYNQQQKRETFDETVYSIVQGREHVASMTCCDSRRRRRGRRRGRCCCCCCFNPIGKKMIVG